jgi:hypothetical protein
MPLHPKQIESVTSLPAPKRYDHFIKVVADRDRAWGLYKDGWALASDDDGKFVFPIWPAEEYAAICAAKSWEGYKPKEIDMEDILDGLLTSLREKQTALGVFPTPTHTGVIVDLTVFENDLKHALTQFQFE